MPAPYAPVRPEQRLPDFRIRLSKDPVGCFASSKAAMEIDITQTLKDTENSLRDFVAATLEKSLGADWPAQSGLTPERLKKWQERKEAEERRQLGGSSSLDSFITPTFTTFRRS
jgi:hypothetical protein